MNETQLVDFFALLFLWVRLRLHSGLWQGDRVAAWLPGDEWGRDAPPVIGKERMN